MTIAHTPWYPTPEASPDVALTPVPTCMRLSHPGGDLYRIDVATPVGVTSVFYDQDSLAAMLRSWYEDVTGLTLITP